MNLDRLEGVLRKAFEADVPAPPDAVEEFIAALLVSTGNFDPRATDGFVPLREEASGANYFAVGKIWMIADQSAQPVSLDLAFAPGPGRVVSGKVTFGVCGRSGGTERLQTALLASPRETVRNLNWAYVFSRGADGWSVLESAERPAAEQ